MGKYRTIVTLGIMGVCATIESNADCVLGDTFDCVLPERDGLVIWDSSGWDCNNWDNVSPLDDGNSIASCRQGRRVFCFGNIDPGFDRIVLNPRVMNPLRSKILGVCDDYHDNRSSNCASTIGNVWNDFVQAGGGGACPDVVLDFNRTFETEELSDLIKIHRSLIPEDWIGTCSEWRCRIYRTFYTGRYWNIQVTLDGVAIKNLWEGNSYSVPTVSCDSFANDQLVIVGATQEIHVAIPGLRQACEWIETVEPLPSD